jgi:uncharacterized protein YlzI (FlbEa/FlbD family)
MLDLGLIGGFGVLVPKSVASVLARLCEYTKGVKTLASKKHHPKRL